MDSTVNSIFGQPFLPESPRLCPLTNRAIPLLAVDLVERMALFAVCFCSVLCTDGIGIFERVFSWRNKSKMGNIDAVAIPANMVNAHALRDVAIVRPPNNAMGTAGLSTEEELSITVFVESSFVENTSRTGLFGYFHKSNDFGLRHIHNQTISYGSMVCQPL